MTELDKAIPMRIDEELLEISKELQKIEDAFKCLFEERKEDE